MTKRKSRYYRYLESAHWKDLRRQTFERDNYMCVHCGSGHNLRGHHVRYRKNFEDCTVDDILTLCNPCHEGHHQAKAAERRAKRVGRERRTKRGTGGTTMTRSAWLIFMFSADDANAEETPCGAR